MILSPASPDNAAPINQAKKYNTPSVNQRRKKKEQKEEEKRENVRVQVGVY